MHRAAVGERHATNALPYGDDGYLFNPFHFLLASAVAVKANRQAMDNMTLIFRTSPHGPPRRLGSASMQAQLAKENKEVN
ncbi:hypothetical protein LZK75_17280 [Rhizobium leguminosarum]|nr:hypothetical protein LZK75_17280 [Rhizobium leguminosarum]